MEKPDFETPPKTVFKTPPQQKHTERILTVSPIKLPTSGNRFSSAKKKTPSDTKRSYIPNPRIPTPEEIAFGNILREIVDTWERYEEIDEVLLQKLKSSEFGKAKDGSMSHLQSATKNIGKELKTMFPDKLKDIKDEDINQMSDEELKKLTKISDKELQELKKLTPQQMKDAAALIINIAHFNAVCEKDYEKYKKVCDEIVKEIIEYLQKIKTSNIDVYLSGEPGRSGLLLNELLTPKTKKPGGKSKTGKKNKKNKKNKKTTNKTLKKKNI